MKITIIKLTASIMLAVGISAVAQAQYTPSGAAPRISAPSQSNNVQQMRTPESEAKQLQASLKLSDAQTTKLSGILQQIHNDQANDKTAQANMKSWQAAHNTKAMIDYMIKQMDVSAARIEKILTPEQDKNFQVMVKNRRDALMRIEASQK